MASSRMTYKENLLQESFRPKPPDLLLNEEINRGAYGVVHRGVFGDRPVAVKKMHELLFDEDRSKEEIKCKIIEFKKEADMLETVQHPHVVKSLGAFYDPKTREPILVMELMAMDLRTFLKKNKGPRTLKVTKQVSICFQIALGLQYLHHLSPPLAHRDLNDKNVLLAENSTVKIGDLGQSKYKDMNDIYFISQTPGNLRFMSPEATSDNPHYTESVDIFSLGVLAVQVATQSEPSPSVHGIGVVPEVERRARDLKKMGDGHPLKPLVLKCLKDNYKERPDIDHVVANLSEIFILEVNKDSEQDRRDRVADERYKEEKAQLTVELEVNKDSEQDRRDRVADERYKEEKAQLTVEETVSRLEANNCMLTKDLETVKEIDIKNHHEEKITRELRTCTEEKSRLQETVSRLEANNHKLTKERDVAREELNAAKVEIHAGIQHEVKISRKLRTSNEENSRLEKSLKELQETVSRLEARNSELTKERDAARVEIDARIQNEEKITRELEASSEENSKLEKCLKELQVPNAAALNDMSLVKIDDEEFSLLRIPPESCALVLKQKEQMLGSIDLAVLVDDLGRVGNFVRLAYNGVVGHVELQDTIRRISCDVTELCDKSSGLVSKVKHTSTSILAHLQSSYVFLFHRQEDMALERLTSTVEVAKGMADAAEELSREFYEQSKKVEGALEDTMMVKGQEEKKKREMEKRRREVRISTYVTWASDSNLADVSIDALHHAMSGLKKLSALMLKIALFWKQMQMHCEDLAGPKMRRMVEVAMKKPVEDRMKVWTNITFKKQFVIYYSKWVALNNVFGICMERIKETQKTLYQYLKENPTIEQARRNVRLLAVEFRKDLEDVQKGY